MRTRRHSRIHAAITATLVPSLALAGCSSIVTEEDAPYSYKASADTEPCTASYKVEKSWGGGYEATLTITSTEALDGWQAAFDFGGNDKLQSTWNAKGQQSGRHVTLSNADYNAKVNAGGRVSIDFSVDGSGSDSSIANVVWNAHACSLNGKAPTPGSKPAQEAPAPNTNAAPSSSTPAPGPTPAPAPGPAPGNNTAPQGTPVAKNGFLKIVNNRLSNERGEAIQLKGVSTHGLQWKGSQYSKDTPRWLRDDWKADLIRIAMYTDEGGYLTNRSVKGKLEEIVQGALDAGIYVIIDWHILKDANPKWHTGEAVEFFREMSSKYGKYANVLYEICNEPNPEKGPVSWMGDIKPYADTVIPEIRHNDPNNIILVGTPMWSSDIKAPLEGKLSYNNVMYSLHKYTGEHDVWNTNYIVETIDQGVPVFVTEWGPTMADGGSSNWNLDRGRADTWVSFLARNKISWAAWSLSEDPQLSAMLKNGPGPSHWRDDQLSESGHYIREKIREGR